MAMAKSDERCTVRAWADFAANDIRASRIPLDHGKNVTNAQIEPSALHLGGNMFVEVKRRRRRLIERRDSR